MNGYIALKTITLSGVEYAAGDSIPADAVLPSRVPALIRTKSIARANNEHPVEAQKTAQDGANDVVGVNLPIQTENGVLDLPASEEDIVKAVEVMQMNAEDAAKAVGNIESETALIIIDACESRKTVKTAVKARAEELNAAADNEGDDDQDGQQDPDGDDADGTGTEGDTENGGDE